MEKVKAIILAAGEGTRMKSKRPKVIHNILGRTMLDYVINAAKQSGAQSVCVVVGHKKEQVESAVLNDAVSFVIQEEQLGTGHAVMQAGDFIGEDQDILVLYGDTPLLTGETLSNLLQFHRQKSNSVSIVSFIAQDPTGYGRIIRDNEGIFLKNVEHKDADELQRQSKEVNAGVYCFQSNALRLALKELKNDNIQKEYYLPDTLEILSKQGHQVDAMVAADASEFFGVNSRVQLAEATEVLKFRINKKHMENGVTIVDPANTYIDPNVRIGMDTVILPGCILEGDTIIGEDCTIGPWARLTNMVVKDGVKVAASTTMDSVVNARSTVGPYAYIRPNSNIGKNVKIGDFVEIKNSNIGDGSKVSHLTYIGDTDAGANINFGCGTVTVNYDGKKKFRTTIEDDAFIGCNANLVAPVTIKKGSYVAAGSTITKDVQEDALAVARARQTAIPDWAKKR